MHKKLVLFVIECQRINYYHDSASAISVSILLRILFMIGLPVMIVPGIESDDDFSIPPLAQGDTVAVITVLKQRHHEPGQGVVAPEGVGYAVLAPGVDLGYHEDVIEQKYFSLVLT